MSSSAGGSFAQLLTLVQDSETQQYVALSATAAVLFDIFFVTLADEVEYVWRRPFRTGSFLYLLSRYATALEIILFLASRVVAVPQSACQSVNSSIVLLGFLAGLGVHGLTVITTLTVARTHRWWIFVLLLLLVGFSGTYLALFSFTACVNTISGGLARQIVNAFNEGFLLLFELTSIGIIASQTWTLYKKKKRENAENTDLFCLLGLLVERGTFRFLLMFLFTLVPIIMGQALRPSISGILSPLENLISSSLMCHFFLKLCGVQSKLEDSDDGKVWTTQVDAVREYATGMGTNVMSYFDGDARQEQILSAWEDAEAEADEDLQYSRPPNKKDSTFFPPDMESQYMSEPYLRERRLSPLPPAPVYAQPAPARKVHASGTIQPLRDGRI